LSEVSDADIKLKQYIAESFSLLLKHPGFDYAVQAVAKNSEQRENIIFKRLEGLAAIC